MTVNPALRQMVSGISVQLRHRDRTGLTERARSGAGWRSALAAASVAVCGRTGSADGSIAAARASRTYDTVVYV